MHKKSMSDKALIKELKEIGYTQRALSRKLEYNECYLSNVLTGKYPMSKKMRAKLAIFVEKHKNI